MASRSAVHTNPKAILLESCRHPCRLLLAFSPYVSPVNFSSVKKPKLNKCKRTRNCFTKLGLVQEFFSLKFPFFFFSLSHSSKRVRSLGHELLLQLLKHSPNMAADVLPTLLDCFHSSNHQV
jgi:hypothetical protein